MRRRHHPWPAMRRPANALVWNLLSAQQIRERMAELTDRATAIVDLVRSEARELSADEQTELDGILGVGKPGTAEYKPGKLDALHRDLERAEKLERRQADLAQARVNPTTPQQAGGPRDGSGDGDGGQDATPRVARIVIPAQCRYRHAQLRAYHGEHADRAAFLAGQFFLGTIFRHEPAARWCADHGIETRFHAALTGGADSAGGFLVPPEIEQAIIDLREEYGVFRRYARVVPMTRDTKDQPYRKTGVTAYFVGENEEITASDKSWGNAKLVAKKIGALVKYSSELDEDSIVSIGDDLTREFAYAFAVKEDQCGFLGDGTSTYGGIVGLGSALAAGSVHVALAGNVTFGTLDLVDFESCVGKLPMYSGIQPAWFISQAGYWNSMARLMDAAGGNTTVLLGEGPTRLSFLGFPVVISQVLPSALSSTTSTILAYFGDLAMAALLGNRRGLNVQLSDQRYFEYDQLGIKGTERFDITIHSVGDASNAGAIVALKTPAS